MALLNYETSPGTLKPGASSYTGPQNISSSPATRSAWWYDSSGQRRSKALEGDLANATGVSTRNGQLVVSGPFGERLFGSDGKSTGGPAGAASEQAAPKFNVIAKDPLIDVAAKEGLAGAQASGKRASTMYEDWLNKFNRDTAAADERLGIETRTYDTAASDLRKALAENERRMATTYDALSAQDVLAARGDSQRRALSGNARAGATLGDSSEEMRIFADAIARARLPYQERLGQLGRENLLQGYQADLSTAPLSRSAYQQAALARLLPVSTGLSLFGQQQQNLANAANLLSSNESVWSDDPRLIPQLPTPSGGYSVPGVPNYGAVRTPVRPAANYSFGGTGGGPSGGGGGGGSSVSRAEQAYFDQTGKWPTNDPYFNDELYVALGGRVGQARAAYDPNANGRMDAANARAERAWGERAFRDDVEYWKNQPNFYIPPAEGPVYAGTPDFPPYNMDRELGDALSRDWNQTRFYNDGEARRANMTVPNYAGNYQLGEPGYNPNFQPPLNY